MWWCSSRAAKCAELGQAGSGGRRKEEESRKRVTCAARSRREGRWCNGVGSWKKPKENCNDDNDDDKNLVDSGRTQQHSEEDTPPSSPPDVCLFLSTRSFERDPESP
mmetsp:Transcript_11818/g.26053  ORF Transcript_11818/g.26053 Transcript_11818/m.26053 type:complete len:107 (+) Transcript_11818:133-453(+)